MNKDAKFFAGLKGGNPIWTDVVKEAKIFEDPQKIVALSRWKTEDAPQIEYIPEEIKANKK